MPRSLAAPHDSKVRRLRPVAMRLALLLGAFAILGWALGRSEAAPPAGQVPINPTYVDTPYVLLTLEIGPPGGSTCRFILEVARPLFQVQLHDARFNPPTFLTYTVPDPNLGYFEDVLAGTTATPPPGSHWMVIGSQRSADTGGGCSAADTSFRRDWIVDWVRAPATTPTPTPTPSPTPPPTAAFTWLQTAPNTIAFDGTSSSAVPPATITTYSWNFGSPPPSAETAPTHVFPVPGLFNVTLTVTDSNGQTDAETKEIRVLGEPIVNSLADTGLADSTSRLCDTGGTIGNPPEAECTLRAAIQAVNNGGGAVIKFNIASGNPIIPLQTPLPEVNATVLIDGRTQPGGWVTLDGSATTDADGLVLAASGIEVRGFAIGNFDKTAIVARGGGATIVGNRLGTNVAGSALLPVGFGVGITSAGNTVGGATAADGNVVAGTQGGVHVLGGGANAIRGNRIGTNETGTVVLVPGGGLGVLVIGGPTAPANGVTLEGNTIAGYNRNLAVAGSETNSTRVVNNLIGVVATGGVAPLENVRLDGSPQPTITGNTIVGATSADLVLAGRREVDFVPGTDPGTIGLQFNIPGQAPSAGPVTGTGGTISGNRIGLDQNGSVVAGTHAAGVLIWSDATTTTLSANRVAGHRDDEIVVFGGGGQTITSNTIGLLGTRTSRGITLRGTSFARIGGAGTGNTIGDTVVGLLLNEAPDARVIGNRIGTDEGGTTAHANVVGIQLLDSARALIQDNQVAASTNQGIFTTSPSVDILANRIGTAADGTSPLPNGFAGIEVSRGAATIADNTIAFNLDRGVEVSSSATAVVVSNSIFGNALIGIDNRANVPAAPTVAGVLRVASPGSPVRTWVAVTGLPSTGVGRVELFGNNDCAGEPQGRVVLVPLGALEVGRSYRLFVVTGRAELHGYTATYTDTGTARTSDLSACVSDTSSPDADADGIPDGIEVLGPFGPGAASRPDQAVVPTGDGKLVGFLTSAGTFSSASPIEPPAGALPPGTSLPFGVVTFRLEGVPTGGSALVTAVLPEGATANGYLKHGRQAVGGSEGWYSFAFDTASNTGVVPDQPLPLDYGDGQLRRGVSVAFVDGQRGDTSFVPDGAIEDPGGPADVPVVNQPPTCQPRTLEVHAGLAATVAPSCSDPESAPLVYTISAQGTKGVASVVGGQLRYEANSGSSGSDAFTYRASDGSLSSAPASVTVTINAPPTPSPTPTPSPSPTPTATPTPSPTATPSPTPTGTPPATGLRLTVNEAVVIPARSNGRDDRLEDEARRRLQEAASALDIPFDDRSSPRGRLALGGTMRPPTGTRLRCGDTVQFTFGPMTETIEGSRFRNVLGQCLYIRPFRDRDQPGLSVVALDVGRGRWSALGRMPATITPTLLDQPVSVSLRIGSTSGSTSIQLTRRGAAWVLRD